MCEITRQNFQEKFSEIVENLCSASFLSIDCEFSGLYDSEHKNSLFDSAEQLFYKKQENLANYQIVEFGLSTFIWNRDTTNFISSTYSFYLLPFINHKKNSKMIWQLSSVDFLCRHNFDFNKVFHDGVNYINKMEEKDIIDMIDEGSIAEIFRAEDIISYKRQVRHWLKKASEGDELVLNVESRHLALTPVLQVDIRKKVANAWASSPEQNVLKIKKVSTKDKLKLLEDVNQQNVLRKKIINSIQGFTRILYKIEELQKPIVGHNVLLDLMLIYQQFFNPKPISYDEFKKNIHSIFPCIYDTKIICNPLESRIPIDECWQNTRLCDLYAHFHKTFGTTSLILSPRIVSKEENYPYSYNFHDAGFDSYCTGYIFVKMAYMHLMWDDTKKKFLKATISKSFKALLSAIQEMKNKLYFPRSQVKWMDLEGSDPKRTPLVLLRIHSKSNGKLDANEISNKLSQYSSTDFMLLNKHTGMIAVNNKQQLKAIREHFAQSEDYVVSDYSFLKHSFWGKALVRGLFVSAFLVITSKVLRFSKMLRSA